MDIPIIGQSNQPQKPKLAVNDPQQSIMVLQAMLVGLKHTEEMAVEESRKHPMSDTISIAPKDFFAVLEQTKAIAIYGIKASLLNQIVNEESIRRLGNLRGFVEMLSTADDKTSQVDGTKLALENVQSVRSIDDRYIENFGKVKASFSQIVREIIEGRSQGVKFSEAQPKPKETPDA